MYLRVENKINARLCTREHHPHSYLFVHDNLPPSVLASTLYHSALSKRFVSMHAA
jgi:hypothetical protein